MTTSTRPTKPLFVPLKAEFYHAFRRGEKTTEYRRLGRRWNPETCAVGRPVLLSYGYSGPRLSAIIVGCQKIVCKQAPSYCGSIYRPEDTLLAIRLDEITPVLGR